MRSVEDNSMVNQDSFIRKVFLHLLYIVAPIIPDKQFLYIKYYILMGKSLRLNCPQTFNEKLQWLKLYDRKPEYTMMVDKVEAKKYVASIIGEKHIIPTIGVYNDVDDIDFSTLPRQFVLKCTHDSGGIVICKDKTKLDIGKAKRKLKKGLLRNYYYRNREWPYKNVKPRIIAEQYMTDSDDELKDYKVFTFDGEPRIIEIDYNRFKGHLRTLYNTDWEKIDARIKFPTDKEREFEKPEALDELLNLSRKISKGMTHVRTDFYIVDNKVYFGELTFYHGSGNEQMTPESFDLELGKWIKLPIRQNGNLR